MPSLENISHKLSAAASGCAALLKAAVRSRKPFGAGPRRQEPLVILGNGPALRPLLGSYSSSLAEMDLLAVNFFANTPEFFSLKPGMYVAADPHFFDPKGDEKVATLWRNIASATWNLSLYIPAGRQIPASLPANIAVKRFNLTPADACGWLGKMLFDRGLAMPRPRNVLIPSVMIALREGYRKIFLAGADHSWSRTLSVDDCNRVVSIQPHFYADDAKERRRVDSEYAGIPLHKIYESLAIAFRSYYIIREYASSLGAEIVNITPGSFIDAFPRLAPEKAIAARR